MAKENKKGIFSLIRIDGNINITGSPYFDPSHPGNKCRETNDPTANSIYLTHGGKGILVDICGPTFISTNEKDHYYIYDKYKYSINEDEILKILEAFQKNPDIFNNKHENCYEVIESITGREIINKCIPEECDDSGCNVY